MFRGRIIAASLLVVAALCGGNLWQDMDDAAAYVRPSSAASGPADVTAGLTFRWTMDSTNNGCVDSVSSITGTVTGCTLASGKIGNAYQFSGTSQYVWMPTNSAYPNNADYSITCWFKSTSAPTANSKFIFESGPAAAQISFYAELLGPSDGSFAGNINIGSYKAGGDYGARNTTTNLNDSTWHFVVWMRSNGTYNIWLDGGMLSKSAQSSGANTLGNCSFTLGARNAFNGYGQPFQGLIDDFRIYNRQLTTNECGQLYQYLP